jgi:hypothetical protein
MVLQKEDKVILNESGKDCYKRNASYKRIPPDEIMEIVGMAGFDNGREIYIVTWNNLTDYYFEECLEDINMRD